MSSAQLSFESGDHLSVRTFSVNEAVSASFQIDVVAMGDEDIDLKKLAGRPASFGLATASGNRIWTGVCAKISQTSVEPDGLSGYSVRLAPVFWLLNHRLNHRIFQHLSIPEIVQKLLGEWQLPFDLKLDETYPKREYCVQYGETDHDFIRRLLVEAGISFYFQTPPGGKETRVVLTDAPTSGEPRQPLPFLRSSSGAEKSEYITGVHIQQMVRPGRAVVRDFDFRRSHYPLAGIHGEGAPENLLEEYFYLPGSSNVRAEGGGGPTPVADGAGTYRHSEKEATSRARRHVEAMRSAASRVGFLTSAGDLAPGRLFSMNGHPNREVANGKKLLVVSSWITGQINDAWNIGGEAVSADMPFRPLLTAPKPSDHHRSSDEGPFQPLTKLDKPRIQGLQSAIVVGPQGEEIHADEYGRVRVQFPWDREARGDDKASCWVRVAQAWAGPGFGMITLPRVGQEVLVGFLEGDPDLPMISGRMFDTMAPVPYPLPEHKTRTSLKSASKNGSNEITFDDKVGSELFYLEASKDLHKIVKKDELEETKGNRHLTVEGDLILSAKGRIIIQAGKDLVVKGGPNVQINPPGDVQSADKPRELSGAAPSPPPPPKPEPPKPEPPKPEPSKPPPSKPEKPGPARPPSPEKSKAALMNEQLFNVNPGGPAGKYNQLAASRRANAEKYQDLARQIGEKYNVPPAMALAWMNRESGLGDFINEDGYSKFDGQGYGLFQVDRRYHSPTGDPFGMSHAEQAMGIYKDFLGGVQQRHPDWTPEEQMAGALVDYNSGPGNATTRPSSAGGWAQMDGGTASTVDPNGDYSRDIWTESQWYAKNLKW